jgi:ATP-dependent DNA ligase
VVIGFTEGSDERRGMLHDLLVALLRTDGCFQVLGRIGSGFTDQQRRDWRCELEDCVVDSDYAEANDGLAYRLVGPRHVIKVSILDVIVQTTRDQPILSMCLDRPAAEGAAAGGRSASCT